MPAPLALLEEILSDGRPRAAGELFDAGVPRYAMQRAAQSGKVGLLTHGVFCSLDALGTRGIGLAAMAIRQPGSVACLMSAAHWHDLSDEDPWETWIAVDKTKTRKPVAGSPALPVRTTWWGPDEMRVGVDTVEIAGTPVRITDPARTVVDLVRLRDRFGDEPAMKALHDYVRTGAPLADLWDHAKALGALARVEPFYRAAEEFSESIPARGP